MPSASGKPTTLDPSKTAAGGASTMKPSPTARERHGRAATACTAAGQERRNTHAAAIPATTKP